MYGLSEELLGEIRRIAGRFHVVRLTLFGSRARGDFRETSDIDLAAYGLNERDEMAMRDALDALPTLLKFDLAPVRRGLEKALLERIEKDGVTLMENAFDKSKQFKRALERTKEAVAQFDITHDSVVRDGVIQRFEFTAELAWKACRDMLLSEGFAGMDSPKSAMRQAFEAGLVTDGQGWLELLQARNITSHVYDDEQAETIYKAIVDRYVPLMEGLAGKL